METTFQLARQGDVNLLLGFIRQFYEIDDYPFDEQIVRAALERIISDRSLGRVWLINEGSAAAGYVVLTFGYSLMYHGRDAFIDEIFIQQSHRGQGIGKKALLFVEERCHELGINALHLEVERGNEAGQALYKKSGFEAHDRHLMTKWIKA
jgi:GNAT superfamily N-acetyltransferase